MQPFLCPKETKTLILETAYLSVWNHTMTKTHGRNIKKHKDLIEVHKSTSWLHPPPKVTHVPLFPQEVPTDIGERGFQKDHAVVVRGAVAVDMPKQQMVIFVLSTGERDHVMYTAEEFWLTDCQFLASPLKQYKVLVLWSIKETKNI